MFLNVAVSISAESAAEAPCQEAEAGDSGYEHHPEPQEQVDLLVEQVDGQHTLHRVALHIAKTTHLEVAHGNTWKAGWRRPVFAAWQGAHDINAVQMVLGAEEGIEDKELAYDVSDEDQLGENVEHYQIVAIATATDEAACAWQEVLETDGTPRPVLTLAWQVPISRQEGDYILVIFVGALWHMITL